MACCLYCCGGPLQFPNCACTDQRRTSRLKRGTAWGLSDGNAMAEARTPRTCQKSNANELKWKKRGRTQILSPICSFLNDTDILQADTPSNQYQDETMLPSKAASCKVGVSNRVSCGSQFFWQSCIDRALRKLHKACAQQKLQFFSSSQLSHSTISTRSQAAQCKTVPISKYYVGSCNAF